MVLVKWALIRIIEFIIITYLSYFQKLWNTISLVVTGVENYLVLIFCDELLHVSLAIEDR